jgi:hypothetical protein
MAFATNDFFRGLDITNKPVTAPAFPDLKKVYSIGLATLILPKGTFGILILDCDTAQTPTITFYARGITAESKENNMTALSIGLKLNHIGVFIPGDFEEIRAAGAATKILIITRELRQYE